MLFPCAERRSPDLEATLTAAGASVTPVVVYRTRAAAPSNILTNAARVAPARVVVLFSPSGVAAVSEALRAMRDHGSDPRSSWLGSEAAAYVAIGPTTGAALRATPWGAGAIDAVTPDPPGLLAAVRSALS